MDNTYPAGAWERLGKALERRRGQLGYGYRQRGTFLRDSRVSLSTKTLARLELGERDYYPDATVSMIERMYRVRPGSLEAFLRDGTELIPEDSGGDYRRHFDDPRLQEIEMLDYPMHIRDGMIEVARDWFGRKSGEAAQAAG